MMQRWFAYACALQVGEWQSRWSPGDPLMGKDGMVVLTATTRRGPIDPVPISTTPSEVRRSAWGMTTWFVRD